MGPSWPSWASLARDAEPQTQAASSPQAADDPLAFFEQRVQEQPNDLAARLDLAHRYLDAGMIEESLSQYAVALDLDPDDAEALAHVGIILFQSGRPEEALRSVERSLSTDPRYPEALFIQGVILLRGLDRPDEAITAFETYLDAAPFGVERGKAKDLIAQARGAREPEHRRGPENHPAQPTFSPLEISNPSMAAFGDRLGAPFRAALGRTAAACTRRARVR